MKKLLNREDTAGYVFTLPFTLGFLFFMLVPMGISLYYSFCDYDILSAPKFIGLSNYRQMLTDTTFWQTIKVTFFFALVSVPLKLLFALIVAMLLLNLPCGLLSALHHRRLGRSSHSLEENVRHGRRIQ